MFKNSFFRVILAPASFFQKLSFFTTRMLCFHRYCKFKPFLFSPPANPPVTALRVLGPGKDVEAAVADALVRLTHWAGTAHKTRAGSDTRLHNVTQDMQVLYSLSVEV